MTALLELRRLSVGYGAFLAVEDLSLAVPEAAVVALLGPNGAGKTTTLKAISGLVRPRSGEIRLRGERIDGLPAHRIARLGVCHVPEQRGIFPALTVMDNLTVAARGAAQGWLDAVLETFPVLADRLDQPAATLSGGQQQMLAMARELATGAPLLMLDELSLGLAPILVELIYQAIAALRERRRTILLVEQYVPRALALAEIVYVLARGRLVFAGEPGELRYAGDLVGSYLGAGP